MKRLFAFGLAVLVCGCGGGGAPIVEVERRPPLSSEPPSLHVAEAALAGGAAPIALAMLDGIVERDPGNVEALVRRGDAHAAMGDRGRAADSYRQALAVDPDDAEARLASARLALAADPAEAERLLRGLLSSKPRQAAGRATQAAALNDLGIALDRLGRHAEAQESYRAAIAADTGMTAAMANLGLSLALSGRPDEAVTMLGPLAAQPAAGLRVRHDFAVALMLTGRRAEARDVVGEQALEPDGRRLAEEFDALAPAAGPAAVIPAARAPAAAGP
jgi:Flp pilus assembly protein TadD